MSTHCRDAAQLAKRHKVLWDEASVVECSDSRQVSQGSVPQPAAATAQADDRQASAVHPQQMHPFTIIPLGAELLEYIGAHHLGVFDDWDCARWTLEDHFGQCGQSCGCCRARNPDDGPENCEECYSIACVQMVDTKCRDQVSLARAAGAPF